MHLNYLRPLRTMRETLQLRRAEADDLTALAALFDAYRQFYGRSADPTLSAQFLQARMAAGDAHVFVAADADGTLLGFTLLYPTWCSLAARPFLILHDLFVHADARKRGVARALMLHVQAFARDWGAQRIVLNTARDNLSAQGLYESLGYEREQHFLEYALRLA